MSDSYICATYKCAVNVEMTDRCPVCGKDHRGAKLEAEPEVKVKAPKTVKLAEIETKPEKKAEPKKTLIEKLTGKKAKAKK